MPLTMFLERTVIKICKHLSDFNYLSVALRCSSFSTQIYTKPNSKEGLKTSKFLVYCNSQITRNGKNGKLKEAESIFNRMPRKSTVSWTAMLTAYAENGEIEKARKMYDEMPERTTASSNAMIMAYIRNNCNVEEAYHLFAEMPERNAVSYAAMITGFVRAQIFEKARKLHSEIPVSWTDPVCSNALISGYLKVSKLEEAKRVFEDMVERDVVSWTTMVDGYCKEGRIVDARGLFEKMPERNVVSWTAMIDGYMKMGCFEDGFDLFLTMRREDDVLVNSTTLTVMFEACGSFRRYREGMQIHGLILQLGFEFDVFLGNSLITMYSKFGFIGEANNIFCAMSKKDMVSWNSLLSGYIQSDKVAEAYKLFEQMPKRDMVSWTTMITGFSSKGNTKKSVQLFGMMPRKDDIAWTAIITGFVSNGEFEEAFHWFIKMLQHAIRPNSYTMSAVLSASASLAILNQGMQIHAQVVQMNMEFELSIQNSLVSMYSKCGHVVDAYRIFKVIVQPNIVSLNSMITGFAQTGLAKEALSLFRMMQDEGHKPNEITFLAILSSCTHIGLVEEGWEYFKMMKSVYDIEPEPDHYACMVDLLGRAGLLDKAVDLINSMPIEPHAGVWGALLGASKTHLRLDLAKFAAQHLMELEPNSAIPYVVLCNLSSVAGKMQDEDLVRTTKNLRGIRKSPGCSWIIVKDKVHTFLAGDQSHKNFEEIKDTL